MGTNVWGEVQPPDSGACPRGYLISSYKNLKENNELQIVEKDFPYLGDSIETTIKIPYFEKAKKQMGDSSKVYHFLWNNFNLPL